MFSGVCGWVLWFSSALGFGLCAWLSVGVWMDSASLLRVCLVLLVVDCLDACSVTLG